MRPTLRTRVILAFLLSGALLSSLFGISAYVASDIVEMLFVNDTLGEELTQYLARIDADPRATPLPSRLRAYASPPESHESLPVYLEGLPPGIHERSDGDHEYHIAVKDHAGRRHYLAYDATLIESWEALLHQLLLAGAALCTLFALWLGFWLARRVVAPVTRLAEEVKRLPAQAHGADLSAHYGNDEVGDLARAFDQRMQTLGGYMQREAEFTADVSHELRTPVAVVRNTAELLLSLPQMDERLRNPLGRVERAARHMGNLIDVFLILAREAKPSAQETAEEYPVQSVLHEVLDARHEDLERHKLSVTVFASAQPCARAPRTALAVVLDNLLGNAIAHTRNGWIRVTLDRDGIEIEDNGAGIPEDEQAHIFQRRYRGDGANGGGAGLGLPIVKRLCDRYGWRIQIDSAQGSGTRARLSCPRDGWSAQPPGTNSRRTEAVEPGSQDVSEWRQTNCQ